MSTRKLIAALSLTASTVACIAGPSDTVPAPAMTQEQQMQRMVELGTPGAGHQRLEPLIGKFKASGQCWNGPDQPAESSEGTSVNTWEFGGRFVRQEYDSTYAGSPFHGTGYTGFNNMTGKYEGVWMDSMTTGIMPMSIGTVDASGKVITSRREFVDPMTGQPAKTREILTIQDANHHMFEWYQTGPDGKEFLMMKFNYTRVD